MKIIVKEKLETASNFETISFKTLNSSKLCVNFQHSNLFLTVLTNFSPYCRTQRKIFAEKGFAFTFILFLSPHKLFNNIMYLQEFVLKAKNVENFLMCFQLLEKSMNSKMLINPFSLT
jgi:hypothetical protein